MNKHTSHPCNHETRSLEIDRLEARAFLDEMARLDELIDYVNYRIAGISEEWNGLVAKANSVHAALYGKSGRRHCRTENAD